MQGLPGKLADGLQFKSASHRPFLIFQSCDFKQTVMSGLHRLKCFWELVLWCCKLLCLCDTELE